MKRSGIIVGLTVLSILGYSCAVFQKGSLDLDTGIVYNMGGAQPVARTEFSLIDADAEDILKNAGLSPNDLKAAGPGIAPGGGNLVGSLGFAAKFPDPYGDFLSKATGTIKQHARYSVTTDFAGKAHLDGIEPGTYFIYGYTETRRGFALWNLKVDIVSGSNALVLDQKNASISF